MRVRTCGISPSISVAARLGRENSAAGKRKQRGREEKTVRLGRENSAVGKRKQRGRKGGTVCAQIGRIKVDGEIGTIYNMCIVVKKWIC